MHGLVTYVFTATINTNPFLSWLGYTIRSLMTIARLERLVHGDYILRHSARDLRSLQLYAPASPSVPWNTYGARRLAQCKKLERNDIDT